MKFNHVSMFGFIFILAVFGFQGGPASGSSVTGNGKIAFVSDRNGNWEIYSMNPDGTAQTRLTNNPANDFAPAWSPDGSKIAFVSDRDGSYQIYVMNADGSGAARLLSDSSNDVTPSWSPDGKRMVFASDRDSDNLQIFVMNSDGTNVQRLTNDNADDVDPTWSPNGTRIAYDDSVGIYTMDPNGGNVVTLTRAQDSQPSWSPDGTHLVFTSQRDGNYEIYLMKADGSSQLRLTSNTAVDITPDFSPDGHKVAFASSRNNYDQVFVMGTDGTNAVPLTTNSGGDGAPTWQSVQVTPCPLMALFWRRNPSSWPVKSLMLGGKQYTQTQMLSLMIRPSGTDASLILADQLIAAKLNIRNKASATPILATIAAADRALHPYSGFLPYHVARNTTTGQTMTSLAAMLLKYNTKALTPTCTP